MLTAGGGVANAKSNAVKAAPAPIPAIALNAPASAVQVGAKPGPLVTLADGTKVHLSWGAAYPVPAGPIGNPKKTYTFCFSQGLLNNPWSTAQKESVEVEAARHPNLKILYFNTNDASQQVADLSTCYNKHVDAFLIWPNTVAPLTPEVEKLYAEHQIVIGMERTVATHNFTSWIYLDYPKSVTALAEYLAKSINYQGVVAESQGTPGSSPQILRHKYFIDVMNKYPKIKVVETTPTNFDEPGGYNAAITFLHSPASKNVVAWYTHYEPESWGVLSALKQVGRSIPQYTIGGTKQSICLVEQGKITYLTPGSAQPLHGDLSVRLAIMKLEGKPIPKYLLLLAPPPITAANAKTAYNAEGWGPSGNCG